MGISMKSFEMPKKLLLDESTHTPTYGKFVAEPFERGYGTTIGNGLRRVLISSIEGTAVTSIKISGVHHEFSAINGVLEDVPQIIMNIKKLVLKSHFKTPKPMIINVEKKGDVTAKDIKVDETVEIVNPDLHIATLTKNVKLKIEMEVARGRGYVPAERNKKEGQSIGVIAVDSIFTPIRKVNFFVENTRVGQITDYDKLIVELWTNGAIGPKEALLYASNILQRHLDIFVGFGKLPEEEEAPEETDAERQLKEKLKVPISELELSVRSSNCLREARIKTIGDLVKKSELEMLKYRNFGKKSLAEINKILQDMGISLGIKAGGDKSKEEPE
ncbi:MAG: DNA-directed RNA polymerase subunit alpha [Candidatus Omnitrophica bacterium]|nr:DNA-directed RNA polymerase subunit alpha [Candidatus Omnitrophota bacterium]MBU0881371.1 DNA-directed RNA polymerase subunit alpha [Candidatus Omnitrophota bacterium]MBU0895806.1 DNA-directed RNA polymerase subunit alpha [Candidatus Omnitrophota bacterium]MBU1808304.1 DNA-directed RNA polymerase subunit alpha [Candidatus Omnitrophota bacterium]